MFVIGRSVTGKENVVTRDLKPHVMGRRWPREIDDEAGFFRQRMRFSTNEAQAVNLYPRNILIACTPASRSTSSYLQPRDNARYDNGEITLICCKRKFAMLSLPENIHPCPGRVGESRRLAQINIGVAGRLTRIATIATHCQKVVVVDHIV